MVFLKTSAHPLAFFSLSCACPKSMVVKQSSVQSQQQRNKESNQGALSKTPGGATVWVSNRLWELSREGYSLGWNPVFSSLVRNCHGNPWQIDYCLGFLIEETWQTWLFLPTWQMRQKLVKVTLRNLICEGQRKPLVKSLVNVCYLTLERPCQGPLPLIHRKMAKLFPE